MLRRGYRRERPATAQRPSEKETMKLNARFNTFTLPRYREAIANHKRYTDFNPLALFRSILENGKLGEAEQLEVLALAKAAFPRFYRHLLLKDLCTYAAISRLGQEPLGEAKMWQYINNLRCEQEKEFAKRKIRNSRVGAYTLNVWRIDGEDRTFMDRHQSVKALSAEQAAHRKSRKRQTHDIRRLLDEENG